MKTALITALVNENLNSEALSYLNAIPTYGFTLRQNQVLTDYANILSEIGDSSIYSLNTVQVENLDSLILEDLEHEAERWVESINSLYFYEYPTTYKTLTGVESRSALVSNSSPLVYPNPTNGIVKVEVETNCIINFYNLNGIKIYDTQLKKGENLIDVSEFPIAVFVYEIVTNNKKWSGKIIKIE